MIVLKEGKIVESGNSDKIIKNSTHQYTKNLLRAADSNWFNNNEES